jgi:hypothetical protein
VKVQGMDEFVHVAWANRIERRAAVIPDTQGLLISNAWKAMPKVLWKVTGTTHTDWTSFCSAIHKVTLTQIIEARRKRMKHVVTMHSMHATVLCRSCAVM